MSADQPRHTARIDRAEVERTAREQTAQAVRDEDKRGEADETADHPSLSSCVLRRQRQERPPG